VLRITRLDGGDLTVLLRLEGQVSGPWVDALRRACEEWNTSAGELVLDLGGVSFIDHTGLALFRELARQRVRFTNGSVFVTEQLREVTHGQR
jgi:anti-anti-sigma factor